MSHVASQKTEKGKPLFSSKEILTEAAELKGCEVVETNVYNWFNRHVGDYPIPEGMKKSELGRNALFVIRVKEPKLGELTNKYNGRPYDVGVVEDPNNPGCYTVVYDFFNDGYGIDDVLGGPVRDEKGEITLLCPFLKQAYDMVCEKHGAADAGVSITFMSLAEAREKAPAYFNQYPRQKDEANTWVSFADEEQQLGAKVSG
jgi:hypothetical protein